MSSLVILDTSILIDYLRRRRHEQRFASLTGIIRTSAVVLAELWRSATRAEEHKFLKQLAANHPVFTPTQRNWIESGEILSLMREERGFVAEKLRDLHFDILIAVTARSHGARLVTSNRRGFELIQQYRPFLLEVW